MLNIYLFVGTVLLYGMIWHAWSMEGASLKFEYRLFFKRLAILVPLCIPFNFNGNVWTVMGNAVGEKGVYSIASLYQKSDGDVLTIFAPLTYQKAGGNSAFAIVGIPSYQNAKDSAGLIAGIAPYQKTANGYPGVLFGIAGRQEGRDVFVAFGLGGYQKATSAAQSFLSLVFFQRVGEKTRSFAVYSTLSADEEKQ